MLIIMAEIYEEDSPKLHELRCCGGNYDSRSDWAGHPDQLGPGPFLGFLRRFLHPLQHEVKITKV
jgi:hypothetical protein